MKTMIVGDIHFGIRNNSLAYLDFQTDWFLNELIPLIEKEKCEKLFFLGDIFDNRCSISLVVLQRARDIFIALSKLGIEIHCIVGNHDLYFRNSKSVHSLKSLEDHGVHVYETPTIIDVNGLSAYMVPWIIKDEAEEVMTTLVDKEFDLCMGHFEINNIEMVPGVYEDKGLTPDLFSNCETVFSGHFHLRRKHKNIEYIGTPYELTWNDYNDQKGVVVYDTETRTNKFIKSQCTPRHLKLSITEDYANETTKENITGNVIRIKFTKGLSEVNKINCIERVNSLNPLSFQVDDDTDNEFESDQDIEASIKDTIGFLNEYLSIIEIPEELNEKVLREKINELYDSCL